MSKIRYQRVTVTGRGHFPVDMLRYDACWPSDDHAVEVITFAGDNSLDEPDQFYTCDLTRVSTNPNDNPTSARWASFGWSVSRVRNLD